MITQEELKELFDYREDGNLIWKTNDHKQKTGDVVGFLGNDIIKIKLYKKMYSLHTLIYIYHNGYIAFGAPLYHINGNKLDNRIENITSEYTKKSFIITQQLLQDKFSYIDGKLFWKHRGRRININTRAGSVNREGYRCIGIGYRHYQEHRIIYIYHYGDIPDGMVIDHIDKNITNNKIENLRLVTNQENNFNRSAKGYTWHKTRKRWYARIGLNNKVIHLGCFVL